MRTTGRTILALVALIALVELAIMALLGKAEGISWAASLGVAALDAGLLAAVLVPFIYLAFIRPARVLEHEFRSLVESVPDAIVLFDAAGTIRYANARMEVMTGFSRAELRGRPFDRIVPPHSVPGMQEAFGKLRAGETLRGEAGVLLTNGDAEVHVEFSAVPRIAEGRFEGAVGVLRDVTERKRMEERLDRAQQDWEDAFDTITDMITVHDADFNIVRANAAAQKILGLPFLEEGVKCFRFYHGTECPPEGCPSCRSLVSGQPSVQEIHEPHLGRFLEIRAIPRFDRGGRVVGLIHVVRDITEKKAAEEALRESERQYRLLFDDNPQPMWVYDAETLRFLAVNDAAVRHYGYERAEFLAMSVAEIRPPEDVPKLLGFLEELDGQDRRGGSSGVWRHRRKDGAIIHVEITSHPLTFSGRAARLVLVNDVTEQKRLEEQLRHAQKMEAVGQLAGGVAHDFNNMLAVIVMYATLLRELPAGDEAREGYVDQILGSAERAAQLTRSLLTFSRKGPVTAPKPVDLNEVIQGIAKLLRRVVGEEIEFRTHLRAKSLFVLADAGQLEQVIMNLCTNARDAMRQGGVLTVESGAQEIGEDFIAAHGFGTVGPYAVFSVSDTGTGMDEATRLRIFEPFFTTKEVGRGTGLGLAIVYGIVKQHRGFINVYSHVGEGTTFKVYLPLFAKEDDRAGAEAPPPPVPRGSELLLLAEDEAEVRTITRAVLEGHGYRVLEAGDGEEALRLFRDSKDRIELFVSDVIMPGRNGRDAYEEMRRIDPRLKVLFTSGYTADVLEQKGLLGGPVDLLSKPAAPSDLLRRVREVLDRA